GDAKYAPAIGVDEQNGVNVTFSDPFSAGRRVVLYAKAAGGAWAGPLNLSDGPWDSASAVVGSAVGNNVEAHILYEHQDRGVADGEIMYVRVGSGAPPPPPCTGTLTLAGKPMVKGNQITGTITPPANCTPVQMQVSLDAHVTDATPKVSYSASIPPITVPQF